MKGRLLLLNLVLFALLGVAAWRARQIWDDARQREQMVLLQEIRLRSALAPPPIPAVLPVTPVAYIAVAQNMLFSRDRNPNVILKPQAPPPPPPPVPDFPVASGVMTFNGETSVFLTTKLGGGQKVYRAGDTVGPFKLVSVDNKDIVFEWNGQQIEKKLAELKPREATTQFAPVQSNAAPGAVVTTPGNSDKSGPGSDVGDGGFRACQAGENSPSGTISNGYRKVIKPSLMGQSCHWESVK